MSALSGKRVLVTRAEGQASALSEALRSRGAEPVVVPTIVVSPPADTAAIERGIQALAAGAYDWVAFTSANAVRHGFLRYVGAGADSAAKAIQARIAVVGPATARALRDGTGRDVDLVAATSTGEGLAAELLAAMGEGKARGARVFLPRAAIARDDLPNALRAAGCIVDAVVAYETHPPPPARLDELRGMLEGGALDAVTFTSSSTVENLVDALGADAPALLARLALASIGPKTTETATQRGLRVDVTAKVSTVPGLVDALEEFFSQPRI